MAQEYVESMADLTFHPDNYGKIFVNMKTYSLATFPLTLEILDKIPLIKVVQSCLWGLAETVVLCLDGLQNVLILLASFATQICVSNGCLF